MITKIDALKSLRPNAEWSLSGDDLTWHDTAQTQPSDEEIKAEISRLVVLEPMKIRIEELKQFLRDTDYVALPDYDKDKPVIIAQRQAAREEIRTLEADILASARAE